MRNDMKQQHDQHLPADTLDPNDPAVLSAILDDDCMRVWECLRRLGPGTDLATLAEKGEMCVVETGRYIDRLVAAKLVRKIRASGSRRLTTFTVTTQEISVAIETDAPNARQLTALFVEQADRRSAALVSGRKPLALATTDEFFFSEALSLSLDRDGLNELRRRIVDLSEFLELQAKRPQRTPAGSIEGCNYAVSVQVVPLAKPILPLPFIGFRAILAGTQDPVRGFRATNSALSVRELRIARELREGRSRGEIARRLSVSPHTIHTFCKRIFRKLGIKRARELQRFALTPMQEGWTERREPDRQSDGA